MVRVRLAYVQATAISCGCKVYARDFIVVGERLAHCKFITSIVPTYRIWTGRLAYFAPMASVCLEPARSADNIEPSYLECTDQSYFYSKCKQAWAYLLLSRLSHFSANMPPMESIGDWLAWLA